MRNTRLGNRTLESWPFPHLVSDQVLSPDEIAEIEEHWPETDLIPEEARGSGYLVGSLLSERFWPNLNDIQKEFWRDFMHSVMPAITRETLDAYAPWIERKFGSLIESVSYHTFALTEMTGDKSGVGCHVHSHDPTWLYTSLIHISDGEVDTDFRGNALFGFADRTSRADYDEEFCRCLATVRPFEHIEGLAVVRNHEFKPARMTSFFESPISYHGTLPPRPGVVRKAKRRMLRMHVYAPYELTRKLYDVDQVRYRQLKYKECDFDERLVSWIKRDIDDLYLAADSHDGTTSEQIVRSIDIKIPELRS